MFAKRRLQHEDKAKGTSFWVMSIMSSICAMSCGKGNRFCTNSSKVMPVDQTSDRMLYVSPARRSGCTRTSGTRKLR